MDHNYDTKSLSQFSIGKRILSILESHIVNRGNIPTKLLDIGCGPGNLTNEIYNSLNKHNVKITGMDVDQDALTKAKFKYKNISFIQNDIYHPLKLDEYDYIFSNEVLHWMPKVPERLLVQEHILYYFFEQRVKEEYKNWGLSNYKVSFNNIYRFLAPGGKAFLQFGLNHQLFNVYRTINEILRENFREHCKEIVYPLFYPELEEVIEIAEGVGFKVLHAQLMKEDLVEEDAEQIFNFIHGFSSNYLIQQLGNDQAETFFANLKKYFHEQDLASIKKDGWYHGFFVLEK